MTKKSILEVKTKTNEQSQSSEQYRKKDRLKQAFRLKGSDGNALREAIQLACFYEEQDPAEQNHKPKTRECA